MKHILEKRSSHRLLLAVRPQVVTPGAGGAVAGWGSRDGRTRAFSRAGPGVSRTTPPDPTATRTREKPNDPHPTPRVEPGRKPGDHYRRLRTREKPQRPHPTLGYADPVLVDGLAWPFRESPLWAHGALNSDPNRRPGSKSELRAICR